MNKCLGTPKINILIFCSLYEHVLCITGTISKHSRAKIWIFHNSIAAFIISLFCILTPRKFLKALQVILMSVRLCLLYVRGGIHWLCSFLNKNVVFWGVSAFSSSFFHHSFMKKKVSRLFWYSCVDLKYFIPRIFNCH